MNEYPECEKWAKSQAHVITNFVEWLGSKGFAICESDGGYPMRSQADLLTLLYDFYEIDPKELERERQAMLDSLSSRKANR